MSKEVDQVQNVKEGGQKSGQTPLNISIWAGMRIKDGGYDNFNKQRDGVTDWEAVYYKTGLFKHIK